MTEQPHERPDRVEPGTAAQFTGEADSSEGSAWEEIGVGRFMPRRVKGSYKGRALG
jgi:hypothetical protein